MTDSQFKQRNVVGESMDCACNKLAYETEVIQTRFKTVR